MLTRAVLSVDAGTTGTRAAYVTDDGSVHSLEYRALAVNALGDGMVEQDARLILESTLDACRTVIERARNQGTSLVAVALAAQRASAVLWDTATGEPLVPAVVWQDSRNATLLRELGAHWDPLLNERVGRRSGVHSVYLWAAQKLRTVPEIALAHREKRLAFGSVESWLLWNVADRAVPVASATQATAAGAYRLADHEYEADWVQALGFPPELLPQLREDADDFGTTDEGVLGISIPIRAALGDQPAGAIGLGCLSPGRAACIHGTGSFVDLMLGGRQPANPGIYPGSLTVVARRLNGASEFAIETYTPATGAALGWVCGSLGWFESAKTVSELAATVPSANGVVFVPALTGLRTPAMEPAARASLSGLSMATTRTEVAFAVLEGIAHSVVSSSEANERVAGLTTDEITVGGGLATSDPLMQLQADLTGVPARRLRDTHAATLKGAAFLAASDGTLWSSLEEAATTLATDRVFVPKLNEDDRLERRSVWNLKIEQELASVAHSTVAHSTAAHSTVTRTT